MAAKVFLLNESGLKPEKVKRSAAEYLCRVLMATKISQYVYQRLVITPAGKMCASRAPLKPFIPDRLPSHKTPGTKARGPVVEQTPECRKHLMTARIFAASAEGLQVGVKMKGLIADPEIGLGELVSA